MKGCYFLEELIKKINQLLIQFNDSFKLEANIIDNNGEKIVNGLKIKELANDGSLFIDELFNMFNQIVSSIPNDYELVYDENKGLAIAKKIVKVEYIFNEEENNIEKTED